MERIAMQARPKLLIGGFSAYSRHKDWARMRAIADRAGAIFWVDMAHVAGLVATGRYPDPLPHAHVVTSTTHKTLRGPRGIGSRKGRTRAFTESSTPPYSPASRAGR